MRFEDIATEENGFVCVKPDILQIDDMCYWRYTQVKKIADLIVDEIKSDNLLILNNKALSFIVSVEDEKHMKSFVYCTYPLENFYPRWINDVDFTDFNVYSDDFLFIKLLKLLKPDVKFNSPQTKIDFYSYIINKNFLSENVIPDVYSFLENQKTFMKMEILYGCC